jgi:branched-chain amino acid transport system ATP-binding protein
MIDDAFQGAEPSVLSVDEIDVFYGYFQALWGVSLRVEKGELLALIGSNGAGKTTILKTILGILRPKAGSITFEGERLDALPPHLSVVKGIAHAPQGRGLFPYMTVADNLKIGAYAKKAREKVHENLEYVFSLFPVLKERTKQLAGTLSGGEQQMLNIGRALMSRPKLLLLDEPSEGLAPILVGQLFDVMVRLNKEGTTILLVEQNVHRALEIANRAYVAEAGKIVMSGESQELMHNELVRKAYLGI